MTKQSERLELFFAVVFFIAVIVMLWPGGVQ